MTSKSSAYYGDPTNEATQSQGDGGSPAEDTQDTSNTEAKESGEEAGTDGDSETFLSPKSVAGDVSPGDTMTFKCVKVYDDEVEWQPVKGDSKPSKPSKMSAMEELDSMATK